MSNNPEVLTQKTPEAADLSEILNQLRAEVAELRAEVSELKQQLGFTVVADSVETSKVYDQDQDEVEEVTAAKEAEAVAPVTNIKEAKADKERREGFVKRNAKKIGAVAAVAAVSVVSILGLSNDNESPAAASADRTEAVVDGEAASAVSDGETEVAEETEAERNEREMREAQFASLEAAGVPQERFNVMSDWDQEFPGPFEMSNASFNGASWNGSVRTPNGALEMFNGLANGSGDFANQNRANVFHEGLMADGMPQHVYEQLASGDLSDLMVTFGTIDAPSAVYFNMAYNANGALAYDAERTVGANDALMLVTWMDDSGNYHTVELRVDCGHQPFDTVSIPTPPTPETPPETVPPTTPPETTPPTSTPTTTPTSTTSTTTPTSTSTTSTTTTSTTSTTSTTLPIHPPADGPPPEATIPPQPQPGTEGYVPGNAEDVVDQQESETPGGMDPTEHGTPAPDGSPSGPDQVVSEPGEDAPDNPDFDPEEQYEGTDEGISNDPNGEDAETDQSDETAENGDLPLDPLAGSIVVGGLGTALAGNARQRKYVSAPKGMPAMDITLEDK